MIGPHWTSSGTWSSAVFNSGMKIRPITAYIGAEICGVDLADGVSPQVGDDLYEVLLDRGVLVFRNQVLPPAAHLAFAATFGPIASPHPLYRQVEGFPGINIIRNDADNPPESEVWHSDLSCKPLPPFASVLCGHEIPDVGGDTLWADMRAVYNALSPRLVAMLDGLYAQHTLEHGFRFLEDFGQTDRQDTMATTTRASFAARHPVVINHPSSGRKVVYVNESFTTRILGVPEVESRALLQALFEMVRNPRFQMRMRWEPGTVVMWDNWATQHFAAGDHYPTYNREVHRVTLRTDGRVGVVGLS